VKRTGGGVEISDLETYRIEQRPQVLNIGDYCNECGNCATFCPTSGAPYRDKPKFHVTAQSFASARLGYYFATSNRLQYKKDGQTASLDITPDGFVYENDEVKVTLDKNYEAKKAELKGKSDAVVSLRHAVEMAVLFQASRHVLPLAVKEGLEP